MTEDLDPPHVLAPHETLVIDDETQRQLLRFPGYLPLPVGARIELSAFVIAEFADAAVGYQDAASSGQIIEDADEVRSLAVTWDTLRLDALPRAASLSLIEEAAR
jgi:hypothetical protein